MRKSLCKGTENVCKGDVHKKKKKKRVCKGDVHKENICLCVEGAWVGVVE